MCSVLDTSCQLVPNPRCLHGLGGVLGAEVQVLGKGFGDVYTGRGDLAYMYHNLLQLSGTLL